MCICHLFSKTCFIVYVKHAISLVLRNYKPFKKADSDIILLTVLTYQVENLQKFSTEGTTTKYTNTLIKTLKLHTIVNVKINLPNGKSTPANLRVWRFPL
jgi:hypothetical protein